MVQESRTGSFDTIRLVAALMVFHGHSFAIAGRPEPWVLGSTFGGAAVLIFFAVSGYWVSRSALDRSLVAFATARTLRIAPGLFVCLLVTIVLCALASSIPINQYFRERTTWLWLQNAAPFFYPMTGEIPGVFEDGASHAVNGSLWTLRYEVFCYIVAACVALFGPKGFRLAAAGFAAFALAVLFRPDQHGALQFPDVLEYHWIAVFGTAFFFGAVLNGVPDRLILLVSVAAGCWLLGLHDGPLAWLLSIVLYGGLAVCFGRNLNLDRWTTRGWDISYGVYIYAFPCEQLAVRAIPPTNAATWLGYYFAALAGTFALALLSWVLIEKPALSAKGVLGKALEAALGQIPGRLRRASPKAAGS